MKEYLIIDGYNVIYYSAQVRGLSEFDLEDERESLIHAAADYSGYTGCELTVVFDAYNREDGDERIEKRADIQIVFTPHDTTADAYIERLVYDMTGSMQRTQRRERDLITVVTSDNTLQQVILACGATRMSSREFLAEIKRVKDESVKEKNRKELPEHHRIADTMMPDLHDTLDAMRKADYDPGAVRSAPKKQKSKKKKEPKALPAVQQPSSDTSIKSKKKVPKKPKEKTAFKKARHPRQKQHKKPETVSQKKLEMIKRHKRTYE